MSQSEKGSGPLSTASGKYLTPPDSNANDHSRKMLEADPVKSILAELDRHSGIGDMYVRWKNHAIPNGKWDDTPALNSDPDKPEKKELEQLRHISWGWIAGLSQRISRTSEFSIEIASQAKSASRAISDAWQDKNGQTAADKADALNEALQKYAQSSKQFGANLKWFRVESRKAVQSIIESVGKNRSFE